MTPKDLLKKQLLLRGGVLSEPDNGEIDWIIRLPPVFCDLSWWGHILCFFSGFERLKTGWYNFTFYQISRDPDTIFLISREVDPLGENIFETVIGEPICL